MLCCAKSPILVTFQSTILNLNLHLQPSFAWSPEVSDIGNSGYGERLVFWGPELNPIQRAVVMMMMMMMMVLVFVAI